MQPIPVRAGKPKKKKTEKVPYELIRSEMIDLQLFDYWIVS